MIVTTIDICIVQCPTETSYNLYGKVLTYLAKCLSENENISHATKLEVVFMCVKLLSTYSIAGAISPLDVDSVTIGLNYDILQALATILYRDALLQRKVLKTCNLRWPILEIQDALKKQDLEIVTQLNEIVEDLLDLLEKPCVVKNNIKNAVEAAQ